MKPPPRAIAEQRAKAAAREKADRLTALLDTLSRRNAIQPAAHFESIDEFKSDPRVIEGLERLLPTLIRDLGSGSLHERMSAMKMLEWLGTRAKPAIPFLRVVLAGENSPERWRAKVAFQSITGEWPD